MAELIPAATVIPLRDTDDGVEVLMLKKNSKVAFGGMWVFPGGRLDAEDWDGLDPDDEEGAARVAAIREAVEEADLVVDPTSVVAFSHWTPPDNDFAPKRFSTWFFACRAPEGIDGEVTIDNGEIHDDVWVGAAEMLRRRQAGEVELAPPTIVTLIELAELGSVDAILERARGRAPFRYLTKPARAGDDIVLLWAGDAGYESGDGEADGPRHRMVMAAAGWYFERS